MSKYGYGAIDTVVHVFTPESFERGEISADRNFRVNTRLRSEHRRGVSIDDYIRNMDRAGIKRSYLVGWPWQKEMIAMAWKYRNIYFGLDACAPKHWAPEIVHYANTFWQDKVIFGSDWLVIDLERAMSDLDVHNFRPESLKKIPRDTTVRMFKVDECLGKKQDAACGIHPERCIVE